MEKKSPIDNSLREKLDSLSPSGIIRVLVWPKQPKTIYMDLSQGGIPAPNENEEGFKQRVEAVDKEAQKRVFKSLTDYLAQ